MHRAYLTVLLVLVLQGTSAQDDGQWTMPGKDYAARRYSALAQITRANVTRLKPVWSFSTGVLGGHEGQPLVVGSTMYVVTPFPNVLYAFDLTREGYPLRWKYRPDVNPTAVGVACCDAINRGAVYAAGKIVYNLLDGHTVAVDANTGRELWKTQIADMGQGETTPMAPFIARDRVLVGPSGGEFGIYGWVKALDLASGKLLWTAHNMGPDSLMIARPGTFRGGANLGVSTWSGDSWRRGGAPVWGWISYDPQLDLIYFGTGNPGPYNTEQRPGENKWTNSVLARRPRDGALVWAYQFTPHDSWDFDANAEMILTDLVVGGRMRKVLVTFNKNGFAYTLDRVSGELLVAEPFAHVTWAKGIDRRTGVPIVDSTKLTGASRGNVKGICPSLEGGKSPVSSSAYSPRTGLFYTATNNLCMNF
ncbi:MAG: PQQ-binding-like beta-propeller repeat protein, partial [Gemmatimonadota bacterium]